jgi:hypothetical protein
VLRWMTKHQGAEPAWPELRFARVGAGRAADAGGGCVGHGCGARSRDVSRNQKELVEGIRSEEIRWWGPLFCCHVGDAWRETIRPIVPKISRPITSIFQSEITFGLLNPEALISKNRSISGGCCGQGYQASGGGFRT